MVVLCVLLFVACLTDCRSARIPNWVVLLIYAGGVGYRYLRGGWQDIGNSLISCFFVFIILFPLFKIGTMGAGDVKLLSAASGYLSGKAVLCFLFYSMLIAAIFSIVKLFRERNGKERFGYLCSYIAEVIKTGHWKIYFQNESEKRKAGICLAVPAFLSVLLHLGGVY